MAIKAGGIEVIVKAINTHIDNTDMCRAGCHALKSMINNGTDLIKCNSLTKQTAKNQVEEGARGIETVVKAINVHVANANMCCAGGYDTPLP